MTGLTVARGSVVEDTDLRALEYLQGNFVLYGGGVPDYVGTPQYDGNDQSRITWTDNTAKLKAFLLSSDHVFNGIKYVYFPTGHYGFSGDKIVLDPTTLPYKSIRLVGAGSDLTILDYIKEDNTGTGNTEQGDNAKELIRFETGFMEVGFYDLDAKCTTKRSFVNGTPSSDPGNWAIYNGTVWFCHIKQATNVRMMDVISEYGNYRGISIDGISDTSPAVTSLFMRRCISRYNTGGGFWLRGVKSSDIADCTFYRNGNLGVTATGYGLTFSQYCSDVKLKNILSYENYRKGIDKHGGLGTITMENVTVMDNIMFQLSFDHQYNSKYPSGAYTKMSLSNVNVLFGVNPDFCNEALSAISPQYRNHISLLLNDKNIDGTVANRLGGVTLSNFRITYMAGITQPMNTYGGIISFASELRMNDCYIDTRNLNMDRVNNKDVYSLTTIGISGKDTQTLVINGGEYLTGDGKLLDTNGNPTNSLFVTAGASNRVIMDNAVLDLQNYVLFGTTGGGRAFDFTGVKKLNDNTFKLRDIQNNTHLVAGSGLAWLGTGMMFKGAASQTNYGCHNTIGFGDCDIMVPYRIGFSDTGVGFKISNTMMTTAGKKVLTGNLYGNLDLSVKGKCVLVETAQWRWLGSANTFQVVTGGTYLASGAPTDYTITYLGANTNFVCKAIPLTSTKAMAVTEFAQAEITGVDDYSVKYLGMV